VSGPSQLSVDRPPGAGRPGRPGAAADLPLQFCGLRLSHPVINASGTYDLIAAAQVFDGLFAPFPFAAFVSKTITLAPRSGCGRRRPD